MEYNLAVKSNEFLIHTNDVHGPLKQQAQWKKPATGAFVLYESPVQELQKRQIHRDRKQTSISRSWGEGEAGVMASGTEVSIWGDEAVLETDSDDCTTLAM